MSDHSHRHHHTHLVPLLGRGRHFSPKAGGCLMEVVGALTGGPWVDRPDSVDLVLAALARSVNDLSSDDGRAGLAPLIPWLVTPAPVDPVRLGAVVAVTAASTALERSCADPSPLLQAVNAGTVVLAGDSRRLSPRARRRHRKQAVAAVQTAAVAVAQASRRARDDALRCLLIDAVDRCRLLDGLPPLPDPYPGPDGRRMSVAIRGRLVAPDGGESMHLRCTALVDQWPAWLQKPWQQRRSELVAAGAPARTTSYSSPAAAPASP